MSDEEMSENPTKEEADEDEEEDDDMDPHMRQLRRQKIRERMIRLQEQVKDKLGRNEQLGYEEVADFVKTGCSKKNFDELRETLDGKQYSLDSNIILTASKMVLQNMEHMASGGSARLFDPKKFAQKLASFATDKVRRRRPSSGSNPLLIDDDERPFEEKVLRKQAKPDGYTGLNTVEWAFMGRFYQNLLQKGPTAEFLTPLIDPNDISPTAAKTRRVTVRKGIRAEEKNVMASKTEAENGKDEAAVSKELDLLLKNLRRIFQEKNIDEIGYYDVAINPHSFAKTIENMFYLSTLLRDNQIRMELDTNGLPVISFVSKTERKEFQHSDPLDKKQAVIAFSYQMFEQIKADLKITVALIKR